MPRLSIVIPCLGGAAEFDGTLVSVLQNRPLDCEVLVLHTERYNDPYALQGEVRFIEAHNQTLTGLLNAALDVAVGEVLHIVGCGLETTEGWTAPALTHFDDPDVAAVSPVVLSGKDQSVLAAGVRWSLGGARQIISDPRIAAPGSGRLRAKVLGPTLAAAFYRRDVLVAIGGFENALGDELADVAAALDLQSLGRLSVCEPASRLVQVHPSASVSAHGFASGRAAERLFWRHAGNGGVALALGLHPFSIGREAFGQAPSASMLTSLMGRAAAWFEFGAVRSHEQRLIEASRRLAELAELRTSRRKSKKRAAEVDIAVPQRRRAA